MHFAVFLILAAQQEHELKAMFDKRSSLTISSYAASERGYLVNSHLLIGFDEAMLVNTQLLRGEAKHVVGLIKHSGKKLTVVFITDDNPDAYLGLDVIHAAFPEAKILATPKVAASIKAHGQKAIDDRKDLDIATTLVVPEPYAKSTLEFSGETIRIRELGPGESDNSAVLYVPSLQLLFAGDLISNQVHLWLVGGHLDGWLKNLEAARSIGTISNVMPSHGAPGPVTLFDDTKKYLQAFAATLGESKEAAIKTMEQKFPAHKLTQVLEESVAAQVNAFALLMLLSVQDQEFNQFAEKGQRLKVSSYAATERGFLVNSHLLVGRAEAMLINAQLLRSEAKRVVSMIERSGKNLTLIFITHDDPDDYLGLEVIHAAFPKAKILATPKVAASIKANAQRAISDRKVKYGADLATSFVAPEPYAEPTLEFSGETLQICELEPGEAENGAVLYVPSEEALFTGELISNRVHLWMVDTHLEGWLKNIEQLRRVGNIALVLPGHGKPGTVALLDETKKYLEAFQATSTRSKASAIATMERKFPDYRWPRAVELSAAAARR